MKKALLLASAALLAMNSYAQTDFVKANGSFSGQPTAGDGYKILAKTTGLGDTLSYGSNAQFSGPWSVLALDRAAPLDSGFLYGTNIGGLKGFAQLYRYTIDAVAPADTTYNVIGVISRFAGTVQAGSTKSVTFNLWKRNTTKVPITGLTKTYVYGLPQASATATQTKQLTALSLTAATVTYFTTPAPAVNYDFYLGYTINYSWASLGGDTIGLRSTQTAGANTYTVETSTLDTLISARNIVQSPTGTWLSMVYDLGVGNGGDQVIYPIIRLNCPNCYLTDVKGITNNNLTFFGNYPNPAINNTTIRFSLATATDVVVNLYDVNGRLLNTITQNNMQAGKNEISLPVSNLAAGNYVYTIETKAGGTFASQLTVAK